MKSSSTSHMPVAFKCSLIKGKVYWLQWETVQRHASLLLLAYKWSLITERVDLVHNMSCWTQLQYHTLHYCRRFGLFNIILRSQYEKKPFTLILVITKVLPFDIRLRNVLRIISIRDYGNVSKNSII